MPAQLNTTTLTLAIIAVLLLIALIFLVRRRRSASIEQRLAAAGHGVISNVLISDGEGGEIHLEHIVLLSNELLLLDVRDLAGNVFGSDTMQDWTVIDGSRRFTFSNPQHALYDRLAALRRLLPGLPVRGVIAFTARAKINKGTPTDVVELDQLLTELAQGKKSDQGATSLLREGWEKLRNEAVVAQFARLMEE
jgi:hypothetical protein